MSKNKVSLSDLEEEMTAIEVDSLKEEQNNADSNYKYLDKELKKVTDKMPYPDVREYDTASDYESIGILQAQKRSNKPYWAQIQKIEPYCETGCLYSGHVKVYDKDFYIMESKYLKTKDVGENNKQMLINVDDRNYSKIIHDWRYPEKNKDVNLSRNIVLRSRRVKNVDVILDRNTSLYSNITDRYLRNALIRNKDNTFCQSIIQTIQEKQNTIRELPAINSFIVQGCAGSGKTMVLLHRLRYLLYNEEISNSKFILLVPSLDFKEFIGKMLSDFNIKKQNVMICKEYYQSVCGKEEDLTVDTSELVFSQDYLERVYSKKFMQQAYQELFNDINSQINTLISVCEEQLNKKIETETEEIEQKKNKIKQDLFDKVQIVTNEIEPFVSVKLSQNLDDIEQFILELKDNWEIKKKEYDKITSPDFKIVIDENDERIFSDPRIKPLIKEINDEKEIINKASIFTVLSHKRKLKNIEEKFNELKKIIIEEITNIEEENMKEKTAKLQFLYDGITMEKVENILNVIVPLFNEQKESYANLENISENMEEYLGEKYSKQILKLNDLIDLSSTTEISIEDYINNLTPALNLFDKNITKGQELLNDFKEFMKSDEEKSILNNKLKLFNNKTFRQIQAFLSVRLFSICKKKIYEEFNIKISKVYKHYWYLNTYCNYLTKELITQNYTHVFIDEAQDLSFTEIDLINKLNLIKENNRVRSSVINLFGDVNQTITKFGISDWNVIHEIPKVYFLEENFRNTNQIVKYCNLNLSMNMTDVGVDMEDVSEFKNLDAAYNQSNNKLEEATFIVKDEYAKQDLIFLLNKLCIKEYGIYTVKESKGLEFKTIYVLSQDMTRNEKYIAFTRALAKLNVIFELPKSEESHIDLIVQGEDDEVSLNMESDEKDVANKNEEVIFENLDSNSIEDETMLNIESEESITENENEAIVSNDSNSNEDEIGFEKMKENINVLENNNKDEKSKMNVYWPGREPEHIRVYLDKVFKKLDQLYPDKMIGDVQTDNKKLAENISFITKVLGYSEEASFLRTYGYKIK